MVEHEQDDVDSDINVDSDTSEDITDSVDYDAELNPADDMRERRYLWIARIFAVFSAVSLCTNVVLLIAIGNLLPLNRIEPYYLTFQSKDEQIVNVEELSANPKIMELVEESLIREFILLRNTVVADVREMERRWGSNGLLQWISEDSVYRDFITSDFQLLMPRIEKERYTKSVTISTVAPIKEERLGKTNRYWQVNYTTLEMVGEASKPIEHKWRATIQVKPGTGKKNRVVVYSDRLKNPLGLKVYHCTVVPDNSSARDSYTK